MYIVYVLESEKDGNRYVGFTKDLARRMREHNSGKNFSTSLRRPLKCIYLEGYVEQSDATRREKFLKTGWGKNYISRVLAEYERKKVGRVNA